MKILITGATSLIGHFLLPKLLSSDYSIFPFSRSKQSSSEINWHQFDGSSLTANPPVQQAEILIHLGPLRILPDLIDDFVTLGGKRIIAFSSTSRFSKLNSGSDSERKMAQDLISAEKSISSKCAIQNISWTLFRPTLIYGAGLDKNVSNIAHSIRQFSFFPLVGNGSGLRQPVHAEDLATACLTILNNEKTFGQAYDLIGGEALTYKEMVERIFLALNKKARFISIPLPIFRIAMKCISIIPTYSHVTPDMADRMNKDLCFDSEKAINDFGYQSRRFNPQQKDLDSSLN